jgi:hypothetical protein
MAPAAAAAAAIPAAAVSRLRRESGRVVAAGAVLLVFRWKAIAISRFHYRFVL